MRPRTPDSGWECGRCTLLQPHRNEFTLPLWLPSLVADLPGAFTLGLLEPGSPSGETFFLPFQVSSFQMAPITIRRSYMPLRCSDTEGYFHLLIAGLWSLKPPGRLKPRLAVRGISAARHGGMKGQRCPKSKHGSYTVHLTD
jgi:hypothetical protein